MGQGNSKLEKALAESAEDSRFYGLENFGNTCYCNSVIQALYFCTPFRERMLQYAEQRRDNTDDLPSCLAELFAQISTSKKKTGVISPRRFVQQLKQDNELFQGFMHQDAHEFLNFLLNNSAEVLEAEVKAQRAAASGQQGGAAAPMQGQASQQGAPISTWVHDIFQGKLVNETRCLQCETVTSREEVFMDLSLEIDQNCSLTSCLRNFSAMETLDREDKFYCDRCCCLQEAQKRMLIREAPQCLILHLKRFKYIETQAGMGMRKLMYRVVFPLELKLSNVLPESQGSDALYALFAVVVHVGSGPHHGHYVSLIKSNNTWLFFDDDNVETITESQVQSTFGSTQEYSNSNMDHGYILFYERMPAAQQHAPPPASAPAAPQATAPGEKLSRHHPQRSKEHASAS